MSIINDFLLLWIWIMSQHIQLNYFVKINKLNYLVFNILL